MNIEEFKAMVKNVKGKRHYAVTHSFGVYDAYKKARKHGWYDIGRPVTEKEFYAIVRGVNLLLAKEIAMGKSVVFPERMGRLELRKNQAGVSIVDGKLRNTYPIDWNKTLNLWYEDKQAYHDKLLIRDPQSVIFHVKYCKYEATYENKTFYKFALNTKIKQGLKENIKKGKIDTLW